MSLSRSVKPVRYEGGRSPRSYLFALCIDAEKPENVREDGGRRINGPPLTASCVTADQKRRTARQSH